MPTTSKTSQQFDGKNAAIPAPPMKTFAGNKALDVIQAQCVAAGIEFDDRLYRTEGNDHVVIRSIKGDRKSGKVLYNTFNGNFFGTTDKGVHFDSASTEHEAEPWFQALLSFFYVEIAANDEAASPAAKAA